MKDNDSVSCLSVDEFIQYARGGLEKQALEKVTEHLKSCKECSAGAKRMTEVFATCRKLTGKKSFMPFRKRLSDDFTKS